MTPAEFKSIRRRDLHRVWGLTSPVSSRELGYILKLKGGNVAQSVRHYERGQTDISGPLEIAMLAMAAGYEPPWLDDALLSGEVSTDDADDKS